MTCVFGFTVCQKWPMVFCVSSFLVTSFIKRARVLSKDLWAHYTVCSTFVVWVNITFKSKRDIKSLIIHDGHLVSKSHFFFISAKDAHKIPITSVSSQHHHSCQCVLTLLFFFLLLVRVSWLGWLDLVSDSSFSVLQLWGRSSHLRPGSRPPTVFIPWPQLSQHAIVPHTGPSLPLECVFFLFKKRSLLYYLLYVYMCVCAVDTCVHVYRGLRRVLCILLCPSPLVPKIQGLLLMLELS